MEGIDMIRKALVQTLFTLAVLGLVTGASVFGPTAEAKSDDPDSGMLMCDRCCADPDCGDDLKALCEC